MAAATITTVADAGINAKDSRSDTATLTDATAACKFRCAINVDDFRETGDVDDTAAFQRAINSLAPTGGEIRIDPRRRYCLSATVVVSSRYHIAIEGANFGPVYDAKSPGIAFTAPVPSLFKVIAPGDRATHGGITLRNISFYDASGEGGAPGKNTVSNALIDLVDASVSTLQNCQFHFISGCAVRTQFFVQSSIIGCRFRYCGAPDSYVLHLGGSETGHNSQAVTIHDSRFEVCYGRAYLKIEPNARAITISSCFFEAATVEYPQSSVPFLDLAGDDFKIIGCTFNRNSAQAILLRSRGIILGCSLETGPADVETLVVTGSRNIIIGNTFTDNRRRDSIHVIGVLNLLVGNRFFQSGGITLEGANNLFSDNIIENPSKLVGSHYLTLADYCTGEGNMFNCYDFTQSGYLPKIGAANLLGKYSRFSNNSCRGWSGKNFITIENPTAVFQLNTHDGIGTFTESTVELYHLFAASDLVLPYAKQLVVVSGVSTIRSIANGAHWAGLCVTLSFRDNATVARSPDLRLNGDFFANSNDTLTLASDGNTWFEVARSENSRSK